MSLPDGYQPPSKYSTNPKLWNRAVKTQLEARLKQLKQDNKRVEEERKTRKKAALSELTARLQKQTEVNNALQKEVDETARRVRLLGDRAKLQQELADLRSAFEAERALESLVCHLYTDDSAFARAWGAVADNE